ncbi:MAG: peptidase M14 [bacterium]|nr:peptidase M14 [bacterium]
MRRFSIDRAVAPAVLSLVLAAAAAGQPSGWTPEQLWQAWPEARFVDTAAPCLRHDELMSSLRSLAERHAGRVRLEEVGRSFQDRGIHMLTLGQGPRKVMLWSQMHGDEPSATPALLDLADYLLANSEEPAARSILEGLTLLIVPMVNPDGSEIYQRLNAQGIDVNRDALNLVTPEGRLLKRLRDQHEPILGFNLHDQNRRTAVGDTGVLATGAVLAVSGDPEGTVTPGRLRAKRACSAIVKALAPFVPGGMARYDEDWSPRAFGDNVTAWGTPVVLIESGGVPEGLGFTDLTRLNFVAILTVLRDLVRDDLAGHDPRIYEDLKRNQSDSWIDVAVRGGEILQPGTGTPYRADLTFNLSRDDRHEAGCATPAPSGSSIFEIGDARFVAAGREVDADGHLILAPFVVAVEGWAARRWLDGASLDRLAELGVGEVRWAVKRRRLLDAMDLAAELAGPGRPRLEPAIAVAPALPRISGRPAEPESDSLAEVLAALGISPPLEGLWPQGEAALPGIRRRMPASFLLVTVGPDGGLDLARASLVSAWLDGVEAGVANR